MLISTCCGAPDNGGEDLGICSECLEHCLLKITINMKLSELYEQYWRLDNGNGEVLTPKKLTESEKKILDNANLKVDLSKRKIKNHFPNKDNID